MNCDVRFFCAYRGSSRLHYITEILRKENLRLIKYFAAFGQ